MPFSESNTVFPLIMIFPLSGVSIPAIQRSVMLFPLPEAPRIPIEEEASVSFTRREKSLKFFSISTYKDIRATSSLSFLSRK